MKVQQGMQGKLTESLAPFHLEVLNESHQHNVPDGSESHFKVVVVSERFVGKPLLARHRTVNAILSEELQGPVHALSIQALTPDEWFERGAHVPPSPPCQGGSAGASGV